MSEAVYTAVDGSEVFVFYREFDCPDCGGPVRVLTIGASDLTVCPLEGCRCRVLWRKQWPDRIDRYDDVLREDPK